ncbi:MAG: FliO/MopB family protein [Clostridia bacterium]|nr:FliO/MopB family protein [Clostridia bacterium]
MENNTFASIIVGMFIVCLALFVFYIVLKKFGTSAIKNKKSRYMAVIDRMIISKDKFIELIEVGDEVLILGMSASSIELLHKTKKENLTEFEDPLKFDTFKDTFNKVFIKRQNAMKGENDEKNIL